MYLPALFGKLCTGKRIRHWTYWATGFSLSALLIGPSLDSGMNCLARSSQYQLAIYVKTWNAELPLADVRAKEKGSTRREGKRDRRRGQQSHRKLNSRAKERAWRTPSDKQLKVTPSTCSTLSPTYPIMQMEKTLTFYTWTLVFPSCCPLLRQQSQALVSLTEICLVIARELIHPEVFMTGHFKWPRASLLHIRSLRPLILLFFSTGDHSIIVLFSMFNTELSVPQNMCISE